MTNGRVKIKSSWEIEQMSIAADVQLQMFDAIGALGGEGITELELVATAEAVSRAAGFGGDISMSSFLMKVLFVHSFHYKKLH